MAPTIVDPATGGQSSPSARRAARRSSPPCSRRWSTGSTSARRCRRRIAAPRAVAAQRRRRPRPSRRSSTAEGRRCWARTATRFGRRQATRSERRPAIEFLGRKRFIAAAEPTRRGGGSARVVSDRSAKSSSTGSRARASSTTASASASASTANGPVATAATRTLVGARAGDVARRVADHDRALARPRRVRAPRARAIAGSSAALLVVGAEAALARLEVVARARHARACRRATGSRLPVTSESRNSSGRAASASQQLGDARRHLAPTGRPGTAARTRRRRRPHLGPARVDRLAPTPAARQQVARDRAVGAPGASTRAPSSCGDAVHLRRRLAQRARVLGRRHAGAACRRCRTAAGATQRRQVQVRPAAAARRRRSASRRSRRRRAGPSPPASACSAAARRPRRRDAAAREVERVGVGARRARGGGYRERDALRLARPRAAARRRAGRASSRA